MIARPRVRIGVEPAGRWHRVVDFGRSACGLELTLSRCQRAVDTSGIPSRLLCPKCYPRV